MRFLWCVILMNLALCADLNLDLSLDEDLSPTSPSTQQQDDDFLKNLELELNQAVKEQKNNNENEDKEMIIPQTNTKHLNQQDLPPQDIFQDSPKNNQAQDLQPQDILPLPNSNPQQIDNQSIPQIPQKPSNITQSPLNSQEDLEFGTPPLPVPQISQEDTQIPNTPLTSQPLENSTPLPTKEEHLSHREQLKIITREELLKKSNECDEKGNEKVCFDVGMIYYQGRSEKGQNLQEAYYYLEKSCKGKKGLGCYEAGIIRANSGVELSYAATLLNQACKMGDLRGCRNLAILYYNGQGVPKNPYQAINLFKFGCEAGDQNSCHKYYLALGNSYRDSKNYPKAKVMYEKACKLGEQAACNELYLLSRKAQPSTRYLFGNRQNKP